MSSNFNEVKNELVSFLLQEQSLDGSFLDYLFSDNACCNSISRNASPLTTALVLEALPETSSDHFINEIKQKALNYLISQKKENWRFDHKIKIETGEDITIDPLEQTFCAINAIKKTKPEIISGADLAKILKILTDTEEKEGGPYTSKINNENKTELYANLHIARYLAQEDVELPELNKFINDEIRRYEHLTDDFIFDRPMIAYFASELNIDDNSFLFSDSKDGNNIIIDLIRFLANRQSENSKKNLLDNIHRLNRSELQICRPLLKYQSGSRSFFAHSPALIAAFGLAAITKLESELGSNENGSLNEFSDIYDKIIRQVRTRFDNLDTDLKTHSLAALENIVRNDRGREVGLLPVFFAKSLGDLFKKIPEKMLIDLGAANVYLWITFKLYDDFLDEEGDPRTLPTANVCLREFVLIYNNLFPTSSDFHELFQEVMDTLEAANAWETANCRAPLAGFHLEIPEVLPVYGEYDRLCDRSYAHGLGPIAILFYLGFNKNSAEVKNLILFFRHYLMGRQLNDDLHDWEKDLQNGHIDGVVASLLQGYEGKLIDLRNDQDINKFKKLFWFDVMPKIAQEALRHLKIAKDSLHSISLIKNIKPMEGLLTAWERSSNLAIKEHRESVEFLNNFEDNSGNIILVNEKDENIGIANKHQAHFSGDLHRAFSIFIFNSKNELLLQKRQIDKYHCGGLWTNTCCSHPRPGEKTEEAAHRRLKEEMGFDCKLEKKFDFTYKVKFDNGLIENEFDHVFFGQYQSEPNLNPEEAEDWKWISLADLEEEISDHPENFTYWLKLILPRVKEMI